MPTLIETHVVEESSAVFTVSFTDEDGAAVVPTTLAWTLTDSNGLVINGRENVAIATPAASVTVTLTGDDLALASKKLRKRHLTILGTYTGGGGEMYLKDVAIFIIDDLVAVT